jgi:hypothetical protein
MFATGTSSARAVHLRAAAASGPITVLEWEWWRCTFPPSSSVPSARLFADLIHCDMIASLSQHLVDFLRADR